MKVIHADHERRYDAPGAPGSARRPVDIDTSLTGFQRLRSLRLYHFSAGAVIDGHAEEDEVFLILTAGSAEIEVGWEGEMPDCVGTFQLGAFTGGSTHPCVAYLPPQSTYKLTPHTEVDVAYARATPTQDLEPSVFHAETKTDGSGVTTFLSQQTHAQHLRLILSSISADQATVSVDLREGTGLASECLVHLRSAPDGKLGILTGRSADAVPVVSWDTVALAPMESATLQLNPDTALSLLSVSAE